MTYKELYEEVRHLGFEGSIEPRSAFLYAARRALQQLFCDVPEEATCRMCLAAQTVSTSLNDRRLQAAEVLTLSGTDGAISLSLGGRGAYTLSDSEGERRGFYFNEGDLRLRPVGQWHLTVTAYTATHIASLRVFEGRFDTEEDVPAPTDAVTVELSRCIPNLLYPIGLPQCAGRELSAHITGTTLTLPADTAGEITVRYARAPRPITGDDITEEVDVPRRAAHLLPLLVASYVFLEDDAERAQYYMTLYRDGMLRLRTDRPSYTAPYADVLGW